MHRSPYLRPLFRALLAAALLAPATAAAQNIVARADSLLRGGRLAAAEDLYYLAVRRQPRDPEARLALGRYLAARGALKVGAVLMEEARYFGGDARAIAVQLAPVYARMGDWRALAALPGTPLSTGERLRATWLQANPFILRGPDSTTIPLAADERGLGAVSLVIEGDTLTAIVDPDVQGIVLDTAWAAGAGLRIFKGKADTDRRRFVAAAPSARLGAMVLANAPVRFVPMGAREARIGLDLLGQLAPTFDAANGRLTLRRAGRLAGQEGAARVPMIVLPSGVHLVKDGTIRLGGPQARALLGARWSFDARRGEVVLGG
jgi:hypothetical protein